MGLLVCVTNPKCDSCIVEKQTNKQKTKKKKLSHLPKLVSGRAGIYTPIVWFQDLQFNHHSILPQGQKCNCQKWRKNKNFYRPKMIKYIIIIEV